VDCVQSVSMEPVMTPNTVDELLASGPDRPLDGLEDAVWSRLQAQKAGERRLTRIASVQMGLFVAALVGSAVVGGVAANQALAHTADLSIFSPHSMLMPSARLIGAAP
jgi:hypothetical protein